MDNLLTIGIIVILECILSVDNAAVLSLMVKDLPEKQQKKALTYGIIGAYVCRGICMLLASTLIKFWFLKPVGGIYLLWLTLGFFFKKKEEDGEVKPVKTQSLWATILLIEWMDLTFSIDNVFAAVAFTDNIYIVCGGVFVGILAIRFVTQWFVKLVKKFEFLESVAFFVIGLLGVKLMLPMYTHFNHNPVSLFLESEHADMIVSAVTILAFVGPVVSSLMFNYPKKHSVAN